MRLKCTKLWAQYLYVLKIVFNYILAEFNYKKIIIDIIYLLHTIYFLFLGNGKHWLHLHTKIILLVKYINFGKY